MGGNHGVPEEAAEVAAGRIAGQFVFAGLGYDLGDECVGVFCPEFVTACFHGVHDIIVVEKSGQPCVAAVTGDGIEIQE